MGTTTMNEQAKKTSKNGHELRCHCSECEDMNISQFKPFHHVPWSVRFTNETRPCPCCQRPVYGRGRGGFILWVCWTCTSKTARVLKVVNKGGDNNFGFAQNEQGQTVYFHLSRQAQIICNGGDHPVLIEENVDPILPRPNDTIRYCELDGDKSLKALWWCFDAELEMALTVINARPTYRFMWRNGRKKMGRLDHAPVMQKLWEGRDLTDLRNDFRCGNTATEDEMYQAKYFERLVSPADPENKIAAVWEACDDPR